MVKKVWLSDFEIKVVCPETNKFFKTYDGLVHIANELHTDVHCHICGKTHLLTENLVALVKGI